MSFFGSIDQLPNDPILFLNTLYKNDLRPNKVNLGVGVYNDDDGRVTLFNCVRQAEEQLYKANLSKNYPPIDGLPGFVDQTLNLIYSSSQHQAPMLHIYGAQALGGTGALKIGAEFLAHNCSRNIYIPAPSWPNHPLIFSHSGMDVQEYPYYDSNESKILFPETCESISSMPSGSVILFQTCCHNPTGADFSEEQWQEIAQLVKQRNLIPFFDLAYQGFGSGIQEDSFAIRHFYAKGIEHLTAYSFSKNMGLYGERVGLLAIAVDREKEKLPVASQIKQTIRRMYSMPPLHGARIVNAVLSDQSLAKNWQKELDSMRCRIKEMRQAFVAGLEATDSGFDFTYLKKQQGLFSYCKLSEKQVMQLRDEHAVFLTSNGRINAAGLNKKNIEYVISALLAVIKA